MTTDPIYLVSGNAPVVQSVIDINSTDAWNNPPLYVVQPEPDLPQTVVLPGQGCDCE